MTMRKDRRKEKKIKNGKEKKFDVIFRGSIKIEISFFLLN